MTHQVSKNLNTGNSVVIDSPMVIGYLFGIFVSFIPAIFFYYIHDSGAFFITIISVFASIYCLLRFLVVRHGYVIDLENNMLEFPGGGFEAHTWTDYFTIGYWLQGIVRLHIPLREIRHIDRGSSHIDLDGDFGAVRLTFNSKGKCDQLYSALVQLGEMGETVIVR